LSTLVDCNIAVIFRLRVFQRQKPPPDAWRHTGEGVEQRGEGKPRKPERYHSWTDLKACNRMFLAAGSKEPRSAERTEIEI
jgi:hypothetical protein